MNKDTKANIKKQPWNKGKSVGQKQPFPEEAISVVRHFLKDNARDLALFNAGIDTMLRGSDLLTLKVEDIIDNKGEIIEEGITRQRKTSGSVEFVLKAHSQAALKAWIKESGKRPHDHIFTGTRKNAGYQPITTTQYRRLIKKWAEYARLDPKQFSGHSTRRTKSSVIYDRTQNLAACQLLLGHKSIASTALYLGVEKKKALDLARDTDV